MSNIQEIVETICEARQKVPARRSVLTAISGIDGFGKAYISAKTLDYLKIKELNAVVINGYGWLNLPAKRFNSHKPAEHFYANAFRLCELKKH